MNHRDTETQRVHRDDPLTRRIIGAAIEVHRWLGPGLLESAYEECLAWELRGLGFALERQALLPIQYKALLIEAAYRIDLIVDAKVVVEIKAVERLDPIHDAQILTYLRLAHLRPGLLLNFHSKVLKDEIRRFAL